MPLITKSSGVTTGEKLLARLCEKTFLRLWSYPNVFRDQGRPGGKGDGKELCDLLVVFANDVIIFSEKSSQIANSGDTRLAWQRWFRRAIQQSAAQVFGAERWLREFPAQIYLDRACSKPFPLLLGAEHELRFHRVIVARKEFADAREKRTLFIRPDVLGEAHFDEPFCVGQIDPARGYVHVLDEYTLDIVLSELDTITDFIEYLTKKERFVTSGKLLGASSEVDLLAYYLTSKTPKGEHDFILPKGVDHLGLAWGPWSQLKSHPKYLAKKEADRYSYIWDAIIEDATDVYFLGPEPAEKLNEVEIAVRTMASERRLSRRALIASFMELLIIAPAGAPAVRTVYPNPKNKIGYVFIILPREQTESKTAYIERLDETLQLSFFLAKSNYRSLEQIVAIGLESMEKGALCRIGYVDASTWSAEGVRLARKIKKSGIFGRSRFARKEHFEFPEPGSEVQNLAVRGNRKARRTQRAKERPRGR